MKDGSQIAGTIETFDGTTYVLSTDHGSVKVKAANIKSVYALK
jgi:hypothetical protein